MTAFKLIEDLKNILNEPLPGWAAQKRLMPEGRQLEIVSESLHPAAVLIALYQKDGDWVFPLIKRSSDGLAHSGQIACQVVVEMELKAISKRR
ncbi:MAG: hypothetical protein HQ507_03290 [Candidatus Marinimicrobia bacterium]|nr:hypothetical protein [Candidatus Neomarinimicrobiota bacterium]